MNQWLSSPVIGYKTHDPLAAQPCVDQQKVSSHVGNQLADSLVFTVVLFITSPRINSS